MQQKFRMKGFTLTLEAQKAAVGFINESSLTPADAMEVYFEFWKLELIPGGRDVNLLLCFGSIVFLNLLFWAPF